jgi:Protein of unknown function (DUF3489)
MDDMTAADCRLKENLQMMPSNNSTALPAAHDAKPARAPTKRAVKSPSLNKKTKPAKSDRPRHGSKKAKIIALLKRPGGTTLEQLQKATGWQAHSVRGFLSGTLKKKMGLRILSSKLPEGVRTYRIVSK